MRVAEGTAADAVTTTPRFHPIRDVPKLSINDFESISSLHCVKMLKERGVVIVVVD
jgi:hypothetical protein